MANTSNHFVSAMLIFGLLLILSLDFTAGEIGVCYGRNGNNLLSPYDVVQLYKRHNIRRMRTYDPDNAILDALRGSGIELNVVITNQYLENLARDQNTANTWVRDHITNFPDVNYKYISVGNEVNPADGATSRYAQFVFPAMRNIYRAICRAGPAPRIKITTTVGMSILGNSYPPEAGEFRNDVLSYIRPILRFIEGTNAPFMVNIYPYFAYISNKHDIDFGYALLEPDHGIEINGVYYDNLFVAMVDAVYAAMDRVDTQSLHTNSRNGYNVTAVPGTRRRRDRMPIIRPPMEGYPSHGGELNGTVEHIKASRRRRRTTKVVTGETGYPSHGGDSASMQNAKTYNQDLVEIVDDGTPRNPDPIETYIFALFDENEKPGAETEKHFGLFYPNGQPKYDMDFN